MKKHGSKAAATPTPPQPPEPPGGSTGSGQRVQEWTSDEVLEMGNEFESAIGVTTITVDDDLVLVDALSDRYFRVNATAAFLWRQLVAGRPVVDIANHLAESYRLEVDDSRRVLVNFANELLNNGLIARKPG